MKYRNSTLVSKLKLIFAVLVVSVMTFSCSSDDLDFAQEELKASSLTKMAEAAALPDSLGAILEVEETEEAKALKELLEKNKSKQRSSYYGDPNYDEYFEDNLWQIRDLPLKIKSRAYNGGKQYLTTAGKDKEVYLDSRQSSRGANQNFYLKKYSATTGLSNVIYSYSDGTPITAGYYTNNPDHKILYVKPNETINSSADWDIKPVSTSGYVQIINNGLIAQGSSGSWWDIYYKVMGVGGSNKITFDKYTSGNAAQEFELLVVGGFELESIEFVNAYNATITPTTNGELTDRDTNRNYSDRDFDLSLAKMGNASSSFVQKKNINFALRNSYDFKVKRPEIIDRKLFLLPSISSPACLTYFESDYSENTGRPDKIRVNIPARSSVTYTFSIPAYRVSCDYKAIATYRNSKITLSGRWNGVIYAEEEGKIDYVITPLDSNGGDIPLRSAPLKSVKLKDIDKNNGLKL